MCGWGPPCSVRVYTHRLKCQKAGLPNTVTTWILHITHKSSVGLDLITELTSTNPTLSLDFKVNTVVILNHEPLTQEPLTHKQRLPPPPPPRTLCHSRVMLTCWSANHSSRFQTPPLSPSAAVSPVLRTPPCSVTAWNSWEKLTPLSFHQLTPRNWDSSQPVWVCITACVQMTVLSSLYEGKQRVKLPQCLRSALATGLRSDVGSSATSKKTPQKTRIKTNREFSWREFSLQVSVCSYPWSEPTSECEIKWNKWNGMKTDFIWTDTTGYVLLKKSTEGDFCAQILYLTNTLQGNTQLTRFHGLHREKKKKKKSKINS